MPPATARRGVPARQSNAQADWLSSVRSLAAAENWAAALQIIDAQLARAPQDADIRAWRARVLAWSGQLSAAESEYLAVVKASPDDPDNWSGLASVYLRQGRVDEAVRAMNRAVELDPHRSDLRSAYGRALRAEGERLEARREFREALALDPGSDEARQGLDALRQEPRHELRFGQDSDLFNFAGANRVEWLSLLSRWSPYWTTSASGNFYQRGGAGAAKFVGSVTGKLPHWGALTVGGAAGHDNSVIPKSEAFFELDRGARVSERAIVRGIELTYGQHWYWYQDARILTLNQSAIFYLPQDWSWSLGITEARSRFSAPAAEWKTSGITRLGFPLGHWAERSLTGNVFYAVGSETFAQVDQIGGFASQNYGGGLRFQFSRRQDVTSYAYYQRRTQGRTQTSFGLSYGIRF